MWKGLRKMFGALARNREANLVSQELVAARQSFQGSAKELVSTINEMLEATDAANTRSRHQRELSDERRNAKRQGN
jgi:hypothetical protein